MGKKAKGENARGAVLWFKKRHPDPEEFSIVLETINQLVHDQLSEP